MSPFVHQLSPDNYNVHTSPMVHRACDACHERRTKCIGRPTCGSCQRSGLLCTFNNVPKKKGPRGKVIEKIDALQRSLSNQGQEDPHLTARRLLAGQLRIPPSPTSLVEPFVVKHELSSTLDLLHPTLQNSLRIYVKRIYPLSPIVHIDTVLSRFDADVHLFDERFAALLLSVCAGTFILPECSDRDVAKGADLLKLAMRLHYTSTFGVKPSLEVIATSMLIGGFLQATTGPSASFMKTNEAIVLCEGMKLDKQETLDSMDAGQRETALAVLWKLAVAHRSTALVQIQSVSLSGQLHELSLVPSSIYTTRLVPITQLFCQVHPTLVDCINGVCSQSKLEPSKLDEQKSCGFEQLQAVMTQQAISDIRMIPELSPVQVADLLVTKAWMHIKIWLVCLSHGILQADEIWPELAVVYPATIAVSLYKAIKSLEYEALASNGRCISVKLGLIAATLEMVVRLPNPPAPSGFESWDHAQTALDEFRQLADTIATRRWVRSELG